MKQIKDFFSIANAINETFNETNKLDFVYLETIKALSRMTYNTIYIIDYKEKRFEYVSNNPLFLCGHTAKTVKKMGYGFYLKYVLETDLDILVKINTIGFEFFNRIPISKKKKYTISCDFHLKDQNGSINLVHHETTPLFLTNRGKIWKSISIVSLSRAHEAGNIRIGRKGDAILFKYNSKGEFWEKEVQVHLTSREKDIIRLAIRGYTIMKIAQILFISISTVKFHRKNVFEKIGVTNMTEAIMFVTENKLI